MNKYESIFESLQESLNNGEITLEEAEVLNDYAYDRYIEEKTALQKRVEDDDEYDKLYDYVANKKDSEKDEKKREALNEIRDSMTAKRERNDYARLVWYGKHKRGDIDENEAEKYKKTGRRKKEEYDIKPQKERKPNTYYNKQKDKNRFNELVKNYNYDPKSKTIEIDGTRTPIRYNHIGDNSYYHFPTRFGKHQMKKRNIDYKNNKNDMSKSDIKKYKIDTKNELHHGITIGTNDLDDFDHTLNHENQHAKDMSIQRMIEREPRFDTKYGTSKFDKETRRKIVELKRDIRNSKKAMKNEIS